MTQSRHRRKPLIRSLRVRWTLVLVGVCVLEALLVAVAVRIATERSFERFVVEEAFAGFVSDVEAAARDSGLVATALNAGAPPLVALPPRGREAAPPRGPAGEPPPRREGALAPGQGGEPPPRRDGARPPPGSLGDGIAFGLADVDGSVTRPFDDHAVGDMLPKDVLDAGQAVIVDGRSVATAFVPRNATAATRERPNTSPESRFVQATSTALAISLALALAISLGVGAWLAGRTVRPLKLITDAARALANGDLVGSVDVARADEVGALADAFNTMSTRLADATALRKRMTADVSHDLRTPVTTVLGTLELIESGALEATPERIGTARAQAERLARLIESFHTLALADAGDLPVTMTTVNVGDSLRLAAAAFEARASSSGVSLTVETNGEPMAWADHDRLAQILDNLITNALRHTPPGGRVALSAQASPKATTISVTDSGSGIPADVLPRVFERSVRADDARSGAGAGIGLSIVRSLANAMGGRVRAESVLGEGTTMSVTLPLAKH